MKFMPDYFNFIVIIIGILLGVVQCFFGYKFFKIILGLSGFFIGFILAGPAVYLISESRIVFILSGIAGGAIGAIFLMSLFYVSIFLAGALLGTMSGFVFLGISNSRLEPLILIILALTGGITALFFQKFMIILATSFTGSWNVITGIASFFIKDFSPINLHIFYRTGGVLKYVIILCWLIFGIIGVLAQYKFLQGSTGKGIEN